MSKREKHVFTRGEVFHAWVNKADGSARYNKVCESGCGWGYHRTSSITGYGNLLFRCDVSVDYKKINKNKESDLFLRYQESLIAIIDRDNKNIIIHSNDDDWNIRRSLPTGYNVFMTDKKLYINEILQSHMKHTLYETHLEYLFNNYLRITNSEHRLIYNKCITYHQYTKDSNNEIKLFIDKYKIKSQPYVKRKQQVRLAYDGIYLAKTKSKDCHIRKYSYLDIYNDKYFNDDEKLLFVQRNFYTRYCYNDRNRMGDNISFSDVLKWWDYKIPKYEIDTKYITKYPRVYGYDYQIEHNVVYIDGEVWQDYYARSSDRFKVIILERNKVNYAESNANRVEAIADYKEHNCDFINTWRTSNTTSIKLTYKDYGYHDNDTYLSWRFIERNVSFNELGVLNTYQLRLTKDMTTIVTSGGARVKFAEARLLYIKVKKLFKQAAKSKSNITINDKIGFYSCIKVGYCAKRANYTSEFIGEEEPYIKIGCHVLWQSDINDFINYYKLNWND